MNIIYNHTVVPMISQEQRVSVYVMFNLQYSSKSVLQLLGGVEAKDT